MIRRAVNVFVQQIKALNDEIDRSSPRIRIIGEAGGPDEPVEMHQIAGPEMIDDLAAQCGFETDDGVPGWLWLGSCLAAWRFKRMINGQDKRFLIGFDCPDLHNGIP